MEILRYRVERFTGTNSDNTTATTVFPPEGETQNPLQDRRAAFHLANSVARFLIEGEDEGLTTHRSSYPIGDGTVDRFEIYVYVVYLIDGKEDDKIISGLPLNAIIDNLDEEIECYCDNNYDTGGSLYNLDASVIGCGNKTVLKDTYDLYAEYLVQLAEEKELNEDGEV